MTWEETIIYIRSQPEYRYLVEKAYFEEDLKLNVERFRSSEEFNETLEVLKNYSPKAKSLLDVGSGNGISAIAFALNGYEVTVSEPDPSETIGAGAVRKLARAYSLNNVSVHEKFAEDIQLNSLFDIVYVRQAMHHAYNLNQFIFNLAGLLKPGGFLFTVRDHVIYDEKDKQLFLESHPLQKFYGGENAFTDKQYQTAMIKAGLQVVKTWKHFDSVMNYFPMTREEFGNMPAERERQIRKKLSEKLGVLGSLPFVQALYKKKIGFNVTDVYNEILVPGRMYSYLAQKS
jgi:SAM-dependent methyltransferase